MPLVTILLGTASVIAFLVWYLQPTLRVTRITLPVRDLPASLEGFKIAQLSDIHYDLPRRRTMTEELLNEIIQTTNREAPDLVCLTGDYVNRDPRPAQALASRLSQLVAKQGVVAVMGNHDHDGDGRVIEAHLKSANITVLTNSCIALPSLPLIIVGFDDLWHGRFKPELAQPILQQQLQRVNASGECPVIIGLSHNPDTADDLVEWPFDLLLSGHTHGGQVMLPIVKIPLLQVFRLIWLLLPQVLRKYVPGQHHFFSVKDWTRAAGLIPLKRADGSSMNLYVSRGLGSHLWHNMRARLFCDPEIAVFTLRKA